MLRRLAVIALVAAAFTMSCSGDDGDTGAGQATSKLPEGGEPFGLDPSRFTREIDNPYWPMRPGSRWVYRETDAEGAVQRIVVTVTDRKKTITGIDAVVVHDRVTEDGELVEDTFDWYAQDADGNVWYLGEDTREYENGKLKTREGSWEHGVDGALGGIIVPAHPRPGMTYREEYYEGHAEDGAEVLSVTAEANVPFGRFGHVFETRNLSPLEPKLVEEKFYARGVGVVLEITVSGGSDRAELISFDEG